MFRGRELSLMVFLSLCCVTAARAEYAVVDLGALLNPPGGASSSFGAINGSGQVAGTNSPDSLAYHALRYSQGLTLDLGTLGGTGGFASDINNSGQIVGRSATSTGTVHAFIWTPGATDGIAANPQMKDLTPTGAASQATAINASGQVAGYLSIVQPGKDTTRAFRYTNGVVTQLPLPAGHYDTSFAYGINDQGLVVGEVYTGSSSLPQAFVYDGTASTALGDLGGGSSSALAINKNNRIVGYSANSDGYDHAFVYANGSITDLNTLGGHYSYANAINSSNQVVGGSFIDDADSIFHAFISDGVTMTDLNSKITSKAADWVLGEAKGINDTGSIVGTGTLLGQKHGFLLKPLKAGDANADGSINFGDLVAVAQNYGRADSVGWEQGDFDGNGTVNFSDLVAVAQSYGYTDPSFSSPLAAGALNASSVPEPGSATTITLAAALLATKRTRRFPSTNA
jgi:probable HAF family extracellular repeat protein